MKQAFRWGLLAVGPIASASGAQAAEAIRASEGIGPYVGVDGLLAVASGTFAGLANPNANRLTLLLDHGSHFHGIGTPSYGGAAAAAQVESTSANNRLPEPYARVDQASSAITLTAGTGAFGGTEASGVLPEGAPAQEYSDLGAASIQSLPGRGAEAEILYGGSDS